MAEAEPLSQGDPAGAMAALESAIKSYERTLRLAGDHDAAAYHLEQARALLDELRRQMAQDGADSQEDGEQQRQGPQQQDQQERSEREPDQQQQEQQQQEAPPQGQGQQEADMPQQTAEGPHSEEDADALARQIIAAEEALAAMMERRRQEMEPVARDW